MGDIYPTLLVAENNRNLKLKRGINYRVLGSSPSKVSLGANSHVDFAQCDVSMLKELTIVVNCSVVLPIKCPEGLTINAPNVTDIRLSDNSIVYSTNASDDAILAMYPCTLKIYNNIRTANPVPIIVGNIMVFAGKTPPLGSYCDAVNVSVINNKGLLLGLHVKQLTVDNLEAVAPEGLRKLTVKKSFRSKWVPQSVDQLEVDCFIDNVPSGVRNLVIRVPNCVFEALDLYPAIPEGVEILNISGFTTQTFIIPASVRRLDVNYKGPFSGMFYLRGKIQAKQVILQGNVELESPLRFGSLTHEVKAQCKVEMVYETPTETRGLYHEMPIVKYDSTIKEKYLNWPLMWIFTTEITVRPSLAHLFFWGANTHITIPIQAMKHLRITNKIAAMHFNVWAQVREIYKSCNLPHVIEDIIDSFVGNPISQAITIKYC